MFATIVAKLPAPPAPPGAEDPDAALRAQLAAQVEAGIELLSAAEPGPPDQTLVEGWRHAAELAADVGGAGLKAAIVGPFSAGFGSPTAAAIDRARAVIRALVDAGCPFVEIHEPAATTIGDDRQARAVFIETQQRLTDALHGHLCLAIVGGSADAAGAETIFGAGYRSYLFDLIEGPDNWRLIVAAPPEAGIVAGALDHRPGKYEVPETVVWAARYAASTGGRGTERVGISSAGSLGALTWDAAIARLGVLGKAARTASLEGEDLARALDPRAVDIRSAALGRFAPFQRPNGRRGGRDRAPSGE